ncbi:hypothetical protein BDZ90DRAFT_231499 [Jaminaea rosea]|uniref:Uncharacterized protein n=1 Tax=Jaminaea rosea TaxID=1569628 RepID=A0A316UT92_9BASI|nr:hypothetical protein BDZ90DRAFT_231499 [Jaminaea rosea]PWN28507.1 hypothetical protein BDZ90DRAFT_231499 [Jaminaea rosea]
MQHLLSHTPAQCLLLCLSSPSSSSHALFDYAHSALSAGKSVLIPRPASLQLSSSQAKALTQLAKEKRAWLGIMVVKRKTGQTKVAAKRLTAVQEAAVALNGAATGTSHLSSSPMSPTSSTAGTAGAGNSNSLRWAADECARCRERGMIESNMIGWEDNIALLECLDEIRAAEGSLAARATERPSDESSRREPEPMGELPALSPTTSAKPAGPSEAAASDVVPGRAIESTSDPQEGTQSSTVPPTSAARQPSTPRNRILDIGPRHFRRTPAPDQRRVDEIKAQEGLAGESGESDADRSADNSTSFTSSQDDSCDSILVGQGDGELKQIQRDIVDLRHMLRQKDAQIAALMEGRAGQAPDGGGTTDGQGEIIVPLSKAKLSKGAGIRLSMPAQGYAGSTPSAVEASRLPRRRGSSVGSLHTSSESTTPTRATFPSMGTHESINPPPSEVNSSTVGGSRGGPSPGGGRSRRDAGTTPPSSSIPLPLRASSAANAQEQQQPQHRGSPAATRISLNGQSSLKEVKEAETDVDDGGTSDRAPSQTGFLAPTRASENRRRATNDRVQGIPRYVRRPSLTASQAQSEREAATSPSSPDPPRDPSPDLVVQRLTNDVEHYRSSLETTRQQLSLAQRNLSSLQRMYDSTKEGLASARVESERRETALMRKDKSLAEALERARRAESEVKELGRSSREWGTRVRVVEAELGDVRRQTAKAEGSYEALRSAWANTRSKWEGEVQGLREELRKTVAEHRAAAHAAQKRLEEVEEQWKGREGQRKGLEAVLEALSGEREKARLQVVAEVGRLVQRVALGEEVRRGHEGDVKGVVEELERLKRLMRAGSGDD